MEKTVADVKKFWDENPLFVGEIDEDVGSRAWFEKFDEVRIRDAFCGDLTDWIPPNSHFVRMLDVGCGPGFWNRFLSPLVYQYNGIDISPRTVALAQRSQQIFGLPGTIAVGNAQEIPFPDNTFDYVCSEGVIHHTPDTAACVREIHRVLKAGGKAHVSVYYKNFFLSSPVMFKMVLGLMRALKITLKGRGREEMARVTSLEEFARMYDGKDNPIGKVYTRDELKAMFAAFSKLEFRTYYVPLRAARVRLPRRFHRWLASIFGLMILVKATK